MDYLTRDKLDILWYSMRGHCITILYHVMENTVANTFNVTYAKCMVGCSTIWILIGCIFVPCTYVLCNVILMWAHLMINKTICTLFLFSAGFLFCFCAKILSRIKHRLYTVLARGQSQFTCLFAQGTQHVWTWTHSWSLWSKRIPGSAWSAKLVSSVEIHSMR